MKKIITTLMLSGALLITNAQKMTVDAGNAKVHYSFVSEKVTGSVEGFEAEIEFNMEDLSKSSISGSVDVTTLNSGNKMRDKHLQAPDYFDAKNFPIMTFKSESFEKTDDGYTVKGKMKIKDISLEQEILFTYSEGSFHGKCIIYSNDYGVHEKKKREDSKVLIKFTVPVK